MHDSAAGRHELQVSAVNGAPVASEVLMVDAALQQVGNGLLASVGVVRKTSARSDAKVVKHQEGREVAELGRADAAAYAGAGAFGLLASEKEVGNLARLHAGLVLGEGRVRGRHDGQAGKGSRGGHVVCCALLGQELDALEKGVCRRLNGGGGRQLGVGVELVIVEGDCCKADDDA